jgi:hypothetical protein
VKRLLSLLLQLLAWPLLGFLIIAFDDLGPSIVNTLSIPANHDLYAFLQWGLLTPVVVQVAMRFPVLDRPLRNLAIHLVAALLSCGLRIIGEPNHNAIIAGVPAAEYLSQTVSRDLLVYASIAVAAHLYLVARRRAAAEHEALVAQTNVAEAERAVIEKTVSPELIIRSLDEIARRVREEPSRVEPLFESFSEFLRSRQEEPLQRELAS